VTAEGAIERAVALLDLGRPQAALEHLRRAVAEQPETAEIHSLIALATLQLGDAPGALKSAETSAGLGPEEEWPHRLRAIALIQLGRDGEARVAALEAARLAPEEAMTHIVLASALQAAGDEAGAEAAARHAVELDPHDADTHSTLGDVLFAQDRPADAIPAFEAALALDPEDANTLNNLAVARLRRHDRGGTGEQFEAAARLNPRLEVARHNILRTGPAGRSHVYRRVTLVAIVGGAVLAVAGAPETLAVVLIVAAVAELVRALELRRLSLPTRALLRDDNRARRLRPRSWDWSWPTRLRPWWWVVLTQLPAPLLLAANVFFLGVAIAGLLAFWIVALGLALPFSAIRTWRWYRRRRPGTGSWRPPVA
jgi:tetratricopeptide (TPR) repeat protein